MREFDFMKNIKTIEEFKDIVKTNKYWADFQYFLPEEAFNIKIIIVSR